MTDSPATTAGEGDTGIPVSLYLRERAAWLRESLREKREMLRLLDVVIADAK